MSHIPSAAMPHAVAHDHEGSSGQRSAADAPPLSSPAPGTSGGAREGGVADRIAVAAGEPDTSTQKPVDGAVTADDEEPHPQSRTRSRAGVAALAIGGVAAVGGIVAAALPLLRERDAAKGKTKGKPKAKRAQKA